MEDKNITFEDLPKAMSWMMDKLNKYGAQNELCKVTR